MRVHQINVGQGHTTLIELADGFRIVIDVDIWNCLVDPIEYLLKAIPPDSASVRRIDLVIITHPHRDHASGLARLLEVFDVARSVGVRPPP